MDWPTRAEDGASVLLEDGPGPLTSPGWNPDGTALAFGRLLAGEDGSARYEIIEQTGPEQQRVLYHAVLSAPQADVWTDPASDNSQALSYLALGRPLSNLSSAEGRQLEDPAAFVARLNELLTDLGTQSAS